MNADQIERLCPGELVLVEGGNFSGRTHFLRTLTGLDVSDRSGVPSLRPAIYVGPEVYNAVSGIAPTVRSELALHGGETAAVQGIAEEMGLTTLFNQNPVTLSGGEQAALVTVSALALQPRVLALDGALEQLDSSRKRKFCSALSLPVRSATATLFTDNRSADCNGSFDRTLKPPPAPAAARRLDLKPVSGSIDIAARATASALRLSGLSFRYGRAERFILRDASAELQPGRIYHLRGPNGSGKTTLAKLICGVLRPSAGVVAVGTGLARTWSRPGQDVAYHFQNPDVQLFCTTVNDEVSVGSADRRSALAAIYTLGLEGILTEHPLDLPFVLRKRVALAATIAMARPWVILDEPTLGQDDTTSRAIAEVIATLARAGTGVIIISHSDSFVGLMAADPIELKGGILRVGTT